MTEKRFKVAVYDDKAINGFAVLDLQKPNSSKRLKYENVYIGSKEGCKIVCNFGNSLADENEQLKIDIGILKDNHEIDREIIDDLQEYVKKLEKENEQLKDKYNEQSVQYEGLEEQVERLLDFKDNVFNLINAKIKHYEHKPFSTPVGQPMSVNFDADVDRIARLSELQDLKKELIE